MLLLLHQHPLVLPHHHHPEVPPVLLLPLPPLLPLLLLQASVGQVWTMPYPAHQHRDLQCRCLS
jgi:hypothetical protein